MQRNYRIPLRSTWFNESEQATTRQNNLNSQWGRRTTRQKQLERQEVNVSSNPKNRNKIIIPYPNETAEKTPWFLSTQDLKFSQPFLSHTLQFSKTSKFQFRMAFDLIPEHPIFTRCLYFKFFPKPKRIWLYWRGSVAYFVP